MTEQSIGEILSGEPAIEAPVEASPVVETPVEVATEPTETVERPRGPDGKFIAKGETEPETVTEAAPPAAAEESGHIPIAALKDERSKRQALETELAQLRQQMQQPQPQPQAQPETQGRPDRWEDPEGYDQWLIGKAGQIAQERATEAFNLQRIQTSVAQFRADKPDYPEVINVFGQMADVNPGLVAQMQQSANPAQFAYDTAKLQMEIMQHGSIEGLIEARVRQREAQAIQSVQGQLPQSAPPTLSHERSVGARSGPTWSGPTPMSEILSR